MNLKNNLNNRDSNRFFIIILSMILSTVFAITYIISRIGFGEPEQEVIIVLKTLFLSYFIFLFPYILIRFLAIFKNKKLKLFPGLESILTFAIIILVALIGFLSRIISFNLLFILVFFVLIFLIFLIIDYRLNYLNKLLALPVILIISGLIIWFVSTRWGLNYSNPYYPESIINGIAHADSLFHSAIVNMIRTHGVPSTGIDGLANISYHYGSHWIFAQLSKLINIGALRFYQLAFPIIFVPLLLKTVLMAILDIKSLYKNDEFYDIKKDKIFWIIISFGFFGLLPQFLKFSYQNAMVFSESYLVSFIFTFLLISTLVFIENNQYFKKVYIVLKNIFYIVLLPLFISIIGFSKISLMLIWVPVLFYLFFRKKYYKNKIYIISLIAVLAFSYLTYLFTTKSLLPSSGFSFNLTYILNLSIFKDRSILINYLGIIINLIFISIWALLFIILKIISKKVEKLNSLFLNSFRTYKTIEIEIILIVVIVGFLPVLIYDNLNQIYYFYDIQRWIAIVFLLGSLNTKYIKDILTIRIHHKQKKMVHFIKFLFIILISFSIISNISISAYNYMRFNHFNRKMIIVNLLKEDNKIILSRYKLLEILNNLSQMPIDKKKQTIIYVPQSNSVYWDLDVFRGDSFIIPAVTGIAMIDGMPEIDGDPMPDNYYGYSDYQPRLSTRDYSIEEIYNKVKEKGFENLIIISYPNDELSLLELNSNNINNYIK